MTKVSVGSLARVRALALTAVALFGFVQYTAAEELVVKSVSVESKKANGESWDAGGNKPDLFVEVNLGGSTKTTNTQQDSLIANLNFATGVEIEVGDQLEVTVWDRDLAANGKVGSTNVLVTGAAIRGVAERIFPQPSR